MSSTTDIDWKETLLHRIPLAVRPGVTKAELPPRLKDWHGSPWAVTITGPNGSGKSWMAAKLAYDFATEREKPLNLIWCNCSLLRAKLQEEISHPPGYGPLYVDRVSEAGLLVLDDMSAARDTEYVKETVRHILCCRYDDLLPTIITMDQIRLEPRLASRLAGGAVITLSGPDRRRQAT